MTAYFQVPVPDSLQKDPDSAEYFRALNLFINDLVSPEGIIATGAATAETTAEQAVTLEEQQSALVTVAAQTDANTTNLSVVQSSSPSYTISNDGTDRSINADSAAGAISTPTVAPAEVENIRDAVLELADFVCTMNRDLQNKDVFG